MISASVLDDERQPKLAWATVIDACRPVVVITDPLPPIVVPGARIGLDVHVVNDLRGAVVGATVSITCTWRDGRRQWAFRGDVDADSVALVGRIDLVVPDEPGDLLLGIALTARDGNDARSPPRDAPAQGSSSADPSVRRPSVSCGEAPHETLGSAGGHVLASFLRFLNFALR